MRLAPDVTLDMEEQYKQEKRPTANCGVMEEELCVGEDGLIVVVPVDAKSRLKKLKQLLECRENELRQAAEYGLGLLEANGELQMQVATLKIQLETGMDEISVDRDTWQRRTERAQQETAQWKRKFAHAEEEKTDLAEEFERLLRRCKCHQRITADAMKDTVTSGERTCPDHLDLIAQLHKELQSAQALLRLKEAELTSLRQWREEEQQQQQEALACEVTAAQMEVSSVIKMKQELADTQRAMSVLAHEKDALRESAEKHDEDMRALKKHLRNAEAGRDDAEILSNELTEKLLSFESRCTRLQRELELLQHVSYFSQAVVDRDDEESDEDDAIGGVKDHQTTVVPDMDQMENIVTTDATDGLEKLDVTSVAGDLENQDAPSIIRITQKRSGLVEPGTPRMLYPITEEGSHVQVPESERETNAKLHHYFHLTALSIIHENSLHERCFYSSSRLTIDMWYREVMAKEVPFVLWHSWLINRIGEVAMLVQDEGGVVQEPTPASPSARSAFFRFSLRKRGGSGCEKSMNVPAASPASVSSSFPSSPVARVSFAVARAFFRLLRKRTQTSADPSPVIGSPVGGSPVG
uniref:Uncharacterized protein n=1 Tax=Peronospora matthiolae TaxID=2874970 RepID=A0AAV1SZX5_9STRA